MIGFWMLYPLLRLDDVLLLEPMLVPSFLVVLCRFLPRDVDRRAPRAQLALGLPAPARMPVEPDQLAFGPPRTSLEHGMWVCGFDQVLFPHRPECTRIVGSCLYTHAFASHA